MPESTPTASVLRFGEIPVIDRGNGVRTTLLLSSSIGSEHLTSGITRFAPGAAITLHSHNCDEQVVIIEGEAVCEIAGELFDVGTYDTTFVPEGIPHRFMNRSDKQMTMLWTYASGHPTRTFTATGQTVPHLSEPDRASVGREG